MIALAAAAREWKPVIVRHLDAFADARLQCHHAAQIANAPAISYLPAAPDDSHTNFTWRPDLHAFTSHPLGLRDPLSFGWRPSELALLALEPRTATIVGSLSLSGRTVAEGHEWVKARCVAAGGDAAKYTAKKHYEIPAHAVATGATFGAEADALGALGTLWANSVPLLDGVAKAPGASTVRLWPHHFDVGLIWTIDEKRSIGCGFTPGDHYYGEPYWYTSPYPRPTTTKLPTLSRGAHWHQQEFFSAILPWSYFGPSPAQGTEVSTYLLSAIANCRSLLGL